jgi:predicted RNA binding protein YcfA (HicA-like mRNA interferase family)
LRRAGFEVVRIKGSHHRMVHATEPERATTVPVHGNADLSKGMLRDIIQQAVLTVEEFINLL